MGGGENSVVYLHAETGDRFEELVENFLLWGDQAKKTKDTGHGEATPLLPVTKGVSPGKEAGQEVL